MASLDDNSAEYRPLSMRKESSDRRLTESCVTTGPCTDKVDRKIV